VEVPGQMTDQAVEREPAHVASEAMSPRSTFRHLSFCGLSAAEAGNLTARLEGLRPIRDGWAVKEIERLVFLRWLIERGRFAGDNQPELQIAPLR
jgi:hypothetical protein